MATENEDNKQLTPEEAWAYYVAQHPPVPAHSYPWWIKCAAVVIMIATAYSLTLLPEFYGAARDFAQAKKEYNAANYTKAFDDMANVLNAGFNTKDTRVLMAKILLKGFPEEQYEYALYLLDGLKLSNNEYKELMSMMPARYFEEEKQQKEQK